MRTSWLLISIAVHGAAITAALGLGAYAQQAAARPPARIALENRVASAPSAVPVMPLPDVVVEPVAEVRPLTEPPPEPLPETLPEPVAQASTADPLPAPEPSSRTTPSMTLQRATLDRVRRPAPQPAPQPVELPIPEPPPVTAPQAAPPAAHVDARARSDNEPPRYPERERRLGCEGRVLVAVAIDATGAVQEVSLREASQHAAFNREALRAVRSWRFDPALEHGVPVASETDVEVVFQLRGR